VEAIEPTSGSDVECVLFDLLDGADTRQGQKKAKVVWEILVSARDSFAGQEIFCLKFDAIGGEDEACLCSTRGRTGLQSCQCLSNASRVAGQDVDVVRLKNAAKVGLVCSPGSQTPQSRFLITEGGKEVIRKLYWVERLIGKIGDGLFDFYGIHWFSKGHDRLVRLERCDG